MQCVVLRIVCLESNVIVIWRALLYIGFVGTYLRALDAYYAAIDTDMRTFHHRLTFHDRAQSVSSEAVARLGQGLTLVHFSAQLEPCLTQENTLHTLDTPSHPLNTGYITPARTPYLIKSARVELKSGRV